ncbi:putative ABC transport system ATP-binding protein [Bacillus oleivorans]|uniref:Putative ABC transport system ATP-binding protein n=1 Tax=Bacillus oleivorans TaxID=1448271 RepID=A0A285CLT6_9BACI|nr:ABC transporter ATP-binding protein [Bacillus oleivorans]SNX68018.1 putative ABC transport system ATP-binding protein [Bacillus oleivorans]
MGVQLKKVTKTYQSGELKVKALKDVEVEIPDAKMVVLLGPSGSGKSTLLNIIGGIDQPDEGMVSVNGWDIAKATDKKLTQFRREEVGFIFQAYNLIPSLTVYENVEVGAQISKNPLSIEEVLEGVGMLDKKDKFPHQLSGGEQQRTAIARAIIKNPSILLCDEPTGALDETTGKMVLELLQKVQEQYGTTILIITHNPGISEIAHIILKMKSGEIVSQTENNEPIPAKQVNWV